MGRSLSSHLRGAPSFAYTNGMRRLFAKQYNSQEPLRGANYNVVARQGSMAGGNRQEIRSEAYYPTPSRLPLWQHVQNVAKDCFEGLMGCVNASVVALLRDGEICAVVGCQSIC